MKYVIVAVAAILTISSFAKPEAIGAKAEIKSASLDKESNLADLEFAGGTVLTNRLSNKVILKLAFNVCEVKSEVKMRKCSETTISYSLPIIKKTVDSCGAKITVGYENKIPVDGLETTITLTDNSDYACGSEAALADTTVEVKTKGYYRLQGKTVEMTHNFKASKLKDFGIPKVPAQTL